jgi:dihydrofolate reductase
MRRVCYSVAASVDGYIAGPNGEADWIPADPDIDFNEIFARFDTLLIGRRTFEFMIAHGRAEVPGMKTVVFSRALRQSDHPGVTIVSENAADVLARLRAEAGKDIWLFGGGLLFGSLVELGLVDAVEIAVVPVLLGGGTPLLSSSARAVALTLTGHRVYAKSGIVRLHYSVRRAA